MARQKGLQLRLTLISLGIRAKQGNIKAALMPAKKATSTG